MIPIFLALLVTSIFTQSTSQSQIRAGIAQIHIGDLSYAAYSIVFNKPLPDSTYDHLVTVSYVSDLAATNGIVINSVCPNTTQANMGCTINSNGNSQNNVVYMSYIASDVGSLLVGTYQHTFSFQNASSLSETLTFSPIVDNSYINSSNVLFVNFFPTVAGISTLDSDFGLAMNQYFFNALTLQLVLNVQFTSVSVRNVTVYFGYIMYDASLITIAQYWGMRFTPSMSAQGVIYGVSGVRKRQIPMRNLQVVIPEKQVRSNATPIQINIFLEIFMVNAFVILTSSDDNPTYYYYQVQPVELSTQLQANASAHNQSIPK